MSASPGSASAPVRTPVADRLLGLVGGAMVVAAIVLLLVGGESDGTAVVASGAPALELVQPEHGATVRTERLHLVFRVEGEFGPTAGGWGNDSLHLHLGLDGMEVMPAAGDVERLSPGLYRWTLARPAPGLHTARLFWSGPDHRPIAGATSRTVQVKVEG